MQRNPILLLETANMAFMDDVLMDDFDDSLAFSLKP